MRTRPRPAAATASAFAGFCFPPDVIVLAARWYLQNLRRGYFELATEEPLNRRVVIAFDELAPAI